MDESLKQLGANLVEASQANEEFSAQRGLINQLFPYVFEASKRMSSRAISRWLEASGTKLSAATIAKALRNPKPYWQEIADEIEASARIFANAHDLDVKEVLENPNAFDVFRSQLPSIEGVTQDGSTRAFQEYEEACHKLRTDWFGMSLLAREACLTHAKFEDEGE